MCRACGKKVVACMPRGRVAINIPVCVQELGNTHWNPCLVVAMPRVNTLARTDREV